MMRPSFTQRRTLTVTTLLVTTGCVFAAAATLYSNNAPHATPHATTSSYESSNMDEVWNGSLLQRTLGGAGITPETLAASGVVSNQVADVVSRARAYLGESGGTLQATLSDARSAKAAHQALERRVQTGISTEQDRIAYAAAATTLANANAAKAAAIESFFLAATAGLAPERVTTLRNLAANRAWEVPLKYRAVAQRTQAQWVALREALAHVRITEQDGGDPNAEQESLIASADADNAVNAAHAGLANLPDIANTWINAVQ